MTRYMLRTLCILLLAFRLCGSAALATGTGVVLNFSEVDVATMVKFISDLTGKNFILDERVKGKISVYSPSRLSIDEAYNVFVSVLELKGFTVVQSGRVAKIVPTSAAKQSGFALLPSGERAPVNESYVAQVIKLENISAQEAMTFLQPMVSKDGHLSAFGPGNLMLMVDSSLNVRKLQSILRVIDTERTREGVEIIYLKNASAESAAAVIRQWLTGGDAKPAPAAGGNAGGGVGSVLADQRLNALLVFGNDRIKGAIREMAAKLDVPPPEASSKVNVYYLENTDATEMAKVLDGVVKGASSQGAATAPGGTAGAIQASPFESGKVTVTPDKASNSLVIMASAADYASLAQVIRKLDRRSKQVYVQCLIAEVSLDKSRAVGMQSAVLGGSALNKYLTLAGLYDPMGTLSSLASALSSVSDSLKPDIQASPVNVVAVLKALDTNDMLNILSTPNIMTADNKEAEINVGENVPFEGSTTISNGLSTTSVERKDVGIKLKITPQISEGDYIRLKIEQEISAVKNDKGQAVDLVTTIRAAKTNIIVRDKETIAIGGLIQDSEEEVISKTPFLGDIPGLGWLFKTKTKTRRKTNLLILLTPNIIRDAADMATVSGGQRATFDEASRQAEPIDVQKKVGGSAPQGPGGGGEMERK